MLVPQLFQTLLLKRTARPYRHSIGCLCLEQFINGSGDGVFSHRQWRLAIADNVHFAKNAHSMVHLGRVDQVQCLCERSAQIL